VSVHVAATGAASASTTFRRIVRAPRDNIFPSADRGHVRL